MRNSTKNIGTMCDTLTASKETVKTIPRIGLFDFAIINVVLMSSCQQIILGPQPGAGDAHGCPFRTFGVDNLVASCQSLGINDTRQLREIQDAIQGKHYHVACTKVWEYTHPGYKGGLVESISHPNQYFERSIALEKEQTAEVKTEDAVKTEAGQV